MRYTKFPGLKLISSFLVGVALLSGLGCFQLFSNLGNSFFCFLEASPHKRRLKCDNNISSRRLMTHLLHQMVHHRTTLRGNGQRSATIARITTHTHTTILIIKRGSSENCAMRYLLRVTLILRQGWVQDSTLLDIVRNEIWIFFCKN